LGTWSGACESSKHALTPASLGPTHELCVDKGSLSPNVIDVSKVLL
jgi:hypothetical protein